VTPPATRPATSAAARLQPPSGVALRTVLDLSSQVLCVCDVQGRIVWSNSGFERALGYGREKVAGRRLTELADAEGRRALVGAGFPADGSAAHAGDGGQAGAVDRRRETAALVTMCCSDGEVRTIDWRIRRDQERALIFAAGRDVTAQVAADEAVRISEARLRAVVGHSPSAIFVKNLSGRYLMANDAWCRLLGRSPEEVVGLTDLDIHAGNARRLSDIEGRLAVDPSVTGELHMETPSGPHDLLVSCFVLSGDDRNRYAVGGIAVDITERKSVEAALREGERLLSAMLEASPDIISLLDHDGRINHVSSAEKQLLGHRHANPSGTELYRLVHPDDFDEVASAFIAMVTGSRSQLHVRYRVRHARGHWVTMDSSAQALVDDEGRFQGAVVVSRDVTSRLESESKLQALRQAAEQASRAKSDFLSRMSHELRTPLNAILGFSQLLQMDELSIQQSETVDHILRAGDHLLKLIDEVLDIARIETGHLELAIRAVYLSEVVSEAISLNRAAAERAEVVVQSAIDADDGPAVLADRQRLLQVLNNLVSNAVKYNRPGGRVDISYQSTPAGRVRLAVADTGQGIRPENMARVFEPFDRLGAEQSGVDGTGVGLALAKNLVERMHGSLEVESVPEVGSTFFVELPQAVLAGGPQGGSARRTTGTSSATFQILLVEDGLASQELIERVVARRPGVLVLGASNGQAALDLARAHHPDLVLLDLDLPDMEASALLEQLGNDAATSSTPVAVLGSERSSGRVRRLLGRGVAGRLAKPVDARALLSLLDAARAASGR